MQFTVVNTQNLHEQSTLRCLIYQKKEIFTARAPQRITHCNGGYLMQTTPHILLQTKGAGPNATLRSQAVQLNVTAPASAAPWTNFYIVPMWVEGQLHY